MIVIRIIEADGKYIDNWDRFVDNSVNGTIFHKRKFLSYHGKRFENRERFLVALDGNTLFAQIALTIEKTNNGVEVYSPYGGSYGGFVFQNQPSYRKGNEMAKAFIDYLKENQAVRCTITPPISCCSQMSLDTFYFNLLEVGFLLANRDISNVVCFNSAKTIKSEISSNARNMARKAEKSGVRLVQRATITDFWKVMDQAYMRLGKTPTHSMVEFERLTEVMPDAIYVDVAYKEEEPIAGIGYFVINNLVNSSFYLCQTPKYRHFQGQSLLILNALECSQQSGYRFFDFGLSSNHMIALENIFSFKENYAKSGYFRETFEWRMQN